MKREWLVKGEWLVSQPECRMRGRGSESWDYNLRADQHRRHFYAKDGEPGGTEGWKRSDQAWILELELPLALWTVTVSAGSDRGREQSLTAVKKL